MFEEKASDDSGVMLYNTVQVIYSKKDPCMVYIEGTNRNSFSHQAGLLGQHGHTQNG